MKGDKTVFLGGTDEGMDSCIGGKGKEAKGLAFQSLKFVHFIVLVVLLSCRS